MARKIVITGANRGIGLALCKKYSALGEEVFAVCRQPSAELRSLDLNIVDNVDVSQANALVHLTKNLACQSIDILINNAGILRSQTLTNLNFEQIFEQFNVNALGPLRVVEALLPKLAEGSKIAMVTSRMGSIDDNSSGASYGYRMSKSALNAASKSLAIDLKPKQIAVAILHPGYVSTDMVNFSGEISPQLAADRLVQRIEELNMDNTGTFWHSNGEILPW